jgi:6-phosphogluconolactonase
MKPDIRIFKDLEKLSRHTADLFIDQAQHAINDRDRFLVSLNGGSTPNRFFQLLGSDYKDQAEWGKIHIFWGDERCVPYDDPGSCYGQARDAFLNHVAIPASNIHPVNTHLQPAEAAKDYAGVLHQFAAPPLDVPQIDLVFLGMGEDGHTASLFPGSPVQAAEIAIPVTANYQDRPANRVSLTQLVFNRARTVVFMATGEKKAETLAEVLSDRYNPERLPAQRINPHDGQLLWLVDEAAAGALPRKTKGLKFCEG